MSEEGQDRKKNQVLFSRHLIHTSAQTNSIALWTQDHTTYNIQHPLGKDYLNHRRITLQSFLGASFFSPVHLPFPVILVLNESLLKGLFASSWDALP